MNDNSIVNSPVIVKTLTPQQRQLWQRLTSAPSDALTRRGYIRTSYLAEAWPGGTCAIGWQGLVRVTIYQMNQRLARHGVKVVGARGGGDGGYVVTVVERQAA